MEIVVVYVAPIPVGHRVEVTWTEEVRRGLVPGQERTDSRPHQPVLVDLDTGVVYLSDWSVGAGRRRSPDQPYDVGVEPMQDHRVARIVRGVVKACRVVTVRGFPQLDVQTHLTIEPDPA
jgi:hypothetical protein